MTTLAKNHPFFARGNSFRWVVRIASLPWAGFWIWFAVADGIGDALHGTPLSLAYGGAFALIIASATTALWLWPRAGGAALVVLGVAAAFYFPMTFTILTLAAPAILIGGLSIASAPDRAAPA